MRLLWYRDVRMVKPSKMYVPKEVASMFNVHPETVRVWIRKGLLRAYVISAPSQKDIRALFILGKDIINTFQDPFEPKITEDVKPFGINPSKTYTMPELAKTLDVGLSTVQRWALRSKIPATLVKGEYHIRGRDFLASLHPSKISQ